MGEFGALVDCIYKRILWFLCFLFMGCNPVEENSHDVFKAIQESLLSFQNLGVTVDSINEEDDSFVFSFSNDATIRLDKVMVFPIDICVGFEEQNGEKRFAKEGYVDWKFCFGDALTITIGKSLFSVNPDAVIRGINHRGYSIDAPENTLPAYRLSKLKGFKYAEADVRFTQDGIPVLIHDATINRTSNGEGEVKAMTLEEIRKFDFGQWKSAAFTGTRIPTLEEFLALCRDIDLYPYIELKVGSREQVEKVVDLVAEYELDGKAVYISFLETPLQYVVDKDPKATIGYLAGSPISESVIAKTRGLKTGSNYVFVDASDYSESAVSLCRQNSIPLEVWTIDSESIIRSLSPYITGVTSNRWHAGRLMMESE